MRADRVLISRDLFLQRVERDELVDDRDHIEARGEVARNDQTQGIAVAQVIALVEQDRAELVAIETLDEGGGEADPGSKEPVAERERALVGDDVDAPIELEPGGREPHPCGQTDLPGDEGADERGRRDELAEERREAEGGPARRQAEHERGDQVRSVLGPTGGELLDAGREREEERDQDRARREGEPDEDGEGAISARHESPSARATEAPRGAARRRCPARRWMRRARRRRTPPRGREPG